MPVLLSGKEQTSTNGTETPYAKQITVNVGVKLIKHLKVAPVGKPP